MVGGNHFFQFSFQFPAQFFRGEQYSIALLGKDERKQYLFGDRRDVNGVIRIDLLLTVQRSGFQLIKGKIVDIQLYSVDFCKAQEIIGIDRFDDLHIYFKIVIFQQSCLLYPLQGKGARFILFMTHRFGVP